MSCLCFVLTIALISYTQDTLLIRNLNQYQEGKVNVLVSPTGKRTVVSILDKSQGWDENEPQTIIHHAASFLRPAAFSRRSYVDPGLTAEHRQRIKQNECINTRFAGLSRSKVKTNFAKGNSNVYSGLNRFLMTLPADEDMGAVVAALAKPYSQRSIQEDKKVTLINVYLYAYAREKDNDYHLILTNADQTIFFNAEISGLPGNNASSYQALKAVRNLFDDYPGTLSCGRYTFPQTPLRILRMKGSLFFDTDHPAGRVGPQGARPQTAWEIHPVTYIRFE